MIPSHMNENEAIAEYAAADCPYLKKRKRINRPG